jgi:prevent-host-death family protein
MVTKPTFVTMSSRWNIASAKAELSRVVREAQREPQVIESRGDPVAVVVAYDDYQRLAAQREGAQRRRAFLELSESLRSDGGVELELPKRVARKDPFARKRG